MVHTVFNLNIICPMIPIKMAQWVILIGVRKNYDMVVSFHGGWFFASTPVYAVGSNEQSLGVQNLILVTPLFSLFILCILYSAFSLVWLSRILTRWSCLIQTMYFGCSFIIMLGWQLQMLIYYSLIHRSWGGNVFLYHKRFWFPTFLCWRTYDRLI